MPTQPRSGATGLVVALVVMVLMAAGLVSTSLVFAATGRTGRLLPAEAVRTDATVSVSVPWPRMPVPVLPTNTPIGPEAALYDALFAGLTDVDPVSGAARPRLADSWESTDAVTWTFHLKDGLVFHDGQPVTAQSFVDSWSFAANLDNGFRNSFKFDEIEVDGSMSGPVAVDDRTLQVGLKSPHSDLPLLMSHPAFAPLPPQCLASPTECADTPIGTGPFAAGDDRNDNVGATVPLERFDDYALDPPQYGEPAITFRDDTEIGTGSIDSGSVDLVQSTQDDPEPRADQIGTSVATNMYYLHFPDTDTYGDPRLRQAISLSVDRESTFATVAGMPDAAATTLTSPALPDTVADGCSWCYYDPDQARTIWKDPDRNGMSLRILVQDIDFDKSLAMSMCDRIQESLDLDCAVDMLPTEKFLSAMFEPEADRVGLFSWYPDGASARTVFGDYFQGMVGYDDAESVTAMQDWDSAVDDATVSTAAGTADERFGQDLPSVPLGCGVNRVTVGGAVNADSVRIDPVTNAIAPESVTVRM